MADQIFLGDSRTSVDRKYVGFTPNGGSIKPVHVAGGVLRSIFGEYNTTMSIKRLALVSDAKGVVPQGNDLETIYNTMSQDEKIEESIDHLVNPLDNAINEKCSRIKKTFLEMMDEYTASYYFISSHTQKHISGTSHVWYERLKVITLPRQLVVNRTPYPLWNGRQDEP